MNENLVSLCAVLNNNKVQYIIAGGYACSLNGHVRLTEDIDVLVLDDDENLQNVINSIYEIFPDLNEKIKITDIRNNVVLKVVHDFEVDFSIRAWTVDYEEAEKEKKEIIINNVTIPFMGINTLIKSKETYREIDKWDIQILNEIRKRKS